MTDLLDQKQHFVVSTPEAEGIDSKGIDTFLEECRKNGSDVHGVLLIRHGKKVFSAFFDPYQPEDKRHVYSVSKSWTATAVGLAVSEGKLSLSDKVISFFPEDLPETVSENLAAMEIRHLLMMGCGHETEPQAPKNGLTWVQAFLKHPVPYQPGTHFLYNSVGTYMLSAILQKVTGEKMVDYLKPRLFDPLSISDVTWDCSPQGICCGGWGIHVSAEDIAKLGMVYLNGGTFEGKRILPESWVKEAVCKQIDNSPNVQKDWEQGYGYQIWRCQNDCFRFDGAFGQYMVAMPEKDALLVVLSNTPNMQVVLDSVWAHLLPAMQDSPLPEMPSEKTDYSCALPELAARDFAGEWSCPDNPWGICSIRLRTGTAGGELCLEMESGEPAILPFGLHNWQRSVCKGDIPLKWLMGDAALKGRIGAAGGWNGSKLLLQIRHRESPHTFQCEVETDSPAIFRCVCKNLDLDIVLPLS